MAKEIVKIDEKSGATLKDRNNILQGGSDVSPGMVMMFGFAGTVLGLFPSMGETSFHPSGYFFDPSSFFGWMASGTAFGLSVARYFMVKDFLESSTSDLNAYFEPTIWQKIKIALYLPVKIKGDREYHSGIKYLTDRNHYDVFADPSETPYKFGSVYKTEINVYPFHYHTHQEWEKTQVGLWDDSMNGVLQSGEYMADEKKVSNLVELMK